MKRGLPVVVSPLMVYAIGCCLLLAFTTSSTAVAQSIKSNLENKEFRATNATINVANKTIDVSRFPRMTSVQPSVLQTLQLTSTQPIPSSEGKASGCISVTTSFDESTNIGVALPGIPEWVSVKGTVRPVVAEGVVFSAGISRSDYPLGHNSHDVDFSVKLDPKYNGLNSDANTLVPGSSTERLLGVEWESKNLPKEFWPTAGDRVWMVGRWIFDCGHLPYKTEIHPPQALAVSRFEPVIFQGRTTPSDAVKTSIFIFGQGGYYNVPAGGRDYEFDVTLPPKPSRGAILHTQVLSLPFGGPSPTLTPVPAGNPTKVHVKYPLASVPASGSNKFAAVIAAGWEEKLNTAGYKQLRVTIDKIKILHDHDPFFSGEWNLWVDVNGRYQKISGLGDVDDGDTINVNLPFAPVFVKNLKTPTNTGTTTTSITGGQQPNIVIIKTTGWESDAADDYFGCGRGFDHAGERHCLLVPAALDDNDEICNLTGAFTQYPANVNLGIGRSISSPIVHAHGSAGCNSDFILTYHIDEIKDYPPQSPVVGRFPGTNILR